MSKLNWAKKAYAVFLLCAATVIAAPAQTFTTLFSFDGRDGNGPYGQLVQATDGYLYGVTSAGSDPYGTVFKISPTGTLKTLHKFEGTDGDGPLGLIQATDGNFYGTTHTGGANGAGTVFKMTPTGTLTTLYGFCSQSNCADGAVPYAPVIQAADGNFYGTTWFGGVQGCSGIYGSGCGTIFKITPTGTLTTLYSFCSQGGSCSDGDNPYSALVQAPDGNFYGTTGGGKEWFFDTSGTVFKITPSGALSTLYSFCSQSGCTDGSSPYTALAKGTDGSFFGTTFYGGANACYDFQSYGCGTVFKITPSGTMTTLYSFCSQTNCADGHNPGGGPLVQAADGNFYATIQNGGANGGGAVYRMTPSGTLTTLYNFCSQTNCTDGSNPDGLVQDTSGIFYGTTALGGANSCGYGTGCGAVFELSASLGPFAETQPTSGKVGAIVKILGTNLTGATAVTFNGTPAAFAVEAGSVIKATVPPAATTGAVQVVTPSGTLSSNVPFRVAP